MNRQCIYCGKDHDLSESDIIPDALTNARLLNKNVCRTDHNNKFSDLFESKVISALAFITNELDIKSSKGKNYASYDAIVRIEGKEFSVSTHGDNDLFNGRVLKSTDKTQIISSYEKAVKIAGSENNVQIVDVNQIEIEKRIPINNEIFFDIAMYRMLAKIAFEWYCVKNEVIGVCSEFNDIISFITTGEGTNPISIIQEEEIYKMLNNQVDLGSHTLVAFENNQGEIIVIISLFGLLIYRVIVAKSKPKNCHNNFLYTELRTDSSRKEIVHSSFNEAQQYFDGIFKQDDFVTAVEICGIPIMIQKELKPIPNVDLYPVLFNLVTYFSSVNDAATGPNDKVNEILYKQLQNITQSSALHKKSIKRFVQENFFDGHSKIIINPHSSNKKAIIMLYSVYLIGLSEEKVLDDSSLQRIISKGFSCKAGEEIKVDDDLEKHIKNIMLSDNDYSEILEQGAKKIINWQN
ncbi:hypothetical protein [uncultured Ruminococcus sp.]|uniref:hypothetical protein n=1 Tax=uncultured Ruminococcus sp. TaxID=165186 RepID=UPI0026199C8C|nr:hypothetical protein [uncultured Ruminococcus sp.]